MSFSQRLQLYELLVFALQGLNRIAQRIESIFRFAYSTLTACSLDDFIFTLFYLLGTL